MLLVEAYDGTESLQDVSPQKLSDAFLLNLYNKYILEE